MYAFYSILLSIYALVCIFFAGFYEKTLKHAHACTHTHAPTPKERTFPKDNILDQNETIRPFTAACPEPQSNAEKGCSFLRTDIPGFLFVGATSPFNKIISFNDLPGATPAAFIGSHQIKARGQIVLIILKKDQ